MILNPLQAEKKKKQELQSKIYLPKEVDLAIGLIGAFIKNNNVIGLKLAILLSGARNQIEYDKDNRVHFNVDELCKIFNIERAELSRQIKKALNTQYSYVTEEGNKGVTTPIHSYEYYQKNKMIWFEISTKAKRLFTELGTGGYQFTQGIRDNLMYLKHKHSIRMQLFLEMVNRYEKKNQHGTNSVGKRIKMTLEELNGYFGVNYANLYDFERKILIPVQEEITLASKLTFVYDIKGEPDGTGRPKFTEVIIDVVDNSKSLFAQ